MLDPRKRRSVTNHWCHDVALFGYSECLLPLSLLHPGSVISGHKFLEETLSLMAKQKETQREQRNFFYLTELDNKFRTISMSIMSTESC